LFETVKDSDKYFSNRLCEESKETVKGAFALGTFKYDLREGKIDLFLNEIYLGLFDPPD
jgi:hypothetical protein